MEEILIDTDVIIDFLRGYNERIQNVFSKIEERKIKVYLSTISVVELYSGQTIEINENRNPLKYLLSFFDIIPLDQHLSQQAGILKREYKLGLADSVIAATCIKNKILLFTFNIKHFKNINHLTIYSLNN